MPHRFRPFSRLLPLIAVLLCTACKNNVPPPTPPMPPTPELQTISILHPDGSPAAGAQTALIPRGRWARVENGIIDDDPAYDRATADDNGRIPLPFKPSPWIMVAVDDTGFAQIACDDLLKTHRIQLKAWAHVNGQMLIANQPGKNLEIVAVLDESPLDYVGGPGVVALGRAFTDEDGHFDMPRVPPGKLCVDREYSGVVRGVTLWEAMAQRQFPIAAPGQTVTVNLGGAGRPIVGSVQLPDELKNRTDWDFSDCTVATRVAVPKSPMPRDIQKSPPDIQSQWYQNFIQTPQGKDFVQKMRNVEYARQQYPGSISKDGRFRVQDVPAGSYSINIQIVTGVGSTDRPTGHVIVDTHQNFDVPSTPTPRWDDPLTIPTVRLQLLPTAPKIGDVAPNFSLTTLDNHPVSLATFRGKYLLLEFWATWCGPCVNRTPDLQRLHTQTKNLHNFQMLSLSIDDNAYEQKRFVDQQKIDWPQAWLGPDTQTEKDYAANTEGIPSFWIIDPEGKIAAHPKYDADLTQAVNAILAKAADSQ